MENATVAKQLPHSVFFCVFLKLQTNLRLRDWDKRCHDETKKKNTHRAIILAISFQCIQSKPSCYSFCCCLLTFWRTDIWITNKWKLKKRHSITDRRLSSGSGSRSTNIKKLIQSKTNRVSSWTCIWSTRSTYQQLQLMNNVWPKRQFNKFSFGQCVRVATISIAFDGVSSLS